MLVCNVDSSTVGGFLHCGASLWMNCTAVEVSSRAPFRAISGGRLFCDKHCGEGEMESSIGLAPWFECVSLCGGEEWEEEKERAGDY